MPGRPFKQRGGELGAASDLAAGVPLVLRLGDGEVATETDSLLHLGRICDAHKIAADTLMGRLQVLSHPTDASPRRAAEDPPH